MQVKASCSALLSHMPWPPTLCLQACSHCTQVVTAYISTCKGSVLNNPTSSQWPEVAFFHRTQCYSHTETALSLLFKLVHFLFQTTCLVCILFLGYICKKLHKVAWIHPTSNGLNMFSDIQYLTKFVIIKPVKSLNFLANSTIAY